MKTHEELAIWKKVNATTTVDELVETLRGIGPVAISGGRGSFDMSDRVRYVVNGASINMLTRNYGIRQQYIYLSDKP